MLNWLEKLLELISTYGFPLVTAAVFLITLLIAIRSLWREYRSLTRRHQELLAETSRLMEFAAYESEIARETITLTLRRLAEIRETLNTVIETIKQVDPNPTEPNPSEE